MAVHRLKYSQKFEQLRKQGVPEAEAHERATKFASKIAVGMRKRPKKPSPLARAIAWGGRKARELRYGPTTYLSPEQRKARKERLAAKPIAVPKKVKPEKVKPDYATARTKAVESALKQAGLTEKELKRLRGKK